MKKTIVIFSNPFGYGPTGKAVAIAEAFIRDGFDNVIMAGSTFVHEIVSKNIKFIYIDERNIKEIFTFLKRIKNPVVISSQNRFAIAAAVSLGISCAFLDGLAWFWKDIPADHLIADVIFWMKYPKIQDKLPQQYSNIYIVPAIIDCKNKYQRRNQILIHIGGCENPLVNIYSKAYFDILAQSLNNIFSSRKIILTGGRQAISYFKKIIHSPNIQILSLTHDKFIKELNKSIHFITTAGQTATLEAFSLGIPTSFLLPMNLSQLALTNILSKYGAAPQHLSWDNYGMEYENLTRIKEKEAIISFSKFAEKIKKNKNILNMFKYDFNKIIQNIPNPAGQEKFIESIGVNGAKEIVTFLVNRWNLI